MITGETKRKCTKGDEGERVKKWVEGRERVKNKAGNGVGKERERKKDR